MPLSHRGVAGILLLTVSTLAAGCHSMRTIEPITTPSTPTAFTRIEPGDLVFVEMKDGSRHRFEVQGIEGDTLVSGSGTRYPRSEMARLQHEIVDGQKTAGLVAGIVAGYVVVMKILASIDFFGT
jgi:hypothetical protein